MKHYTSNCFTSSGSVNFVLRPSSDYSDWRMSANNDWQLTNRMQRFIWFQMEKQLWNTDAFQERYVNGRLPRRQITETLTCFLNCLWINVDIFQEVVVANLKWIEHCVNYTTDVCAEVSSPTNYYIIYRTSPTQYRSQYHAGQHNLWHKVTASFISQ